MKHYYLIFLASCLMLLSACVTSKKVVMVQDMKVDTTYRILTPPDLSIQARDRIGITVSSRNPELAAPFNQFGGGYQINERGDLSAGAATNADTRGYLVDDQGGIDFPILGRLQLAGKTLEQTRQLVQQRLVSEKLISDPIVRVELLNLKVNMMGEVNRVGVLDVPDARITLLEAISRAGGLTANAASERISIIREEDGKRRMIVLDIKSTAIFDSPAFYLKQNDIVYIEPRGAQLSEKEQNNWRYISTGIGLLATIFTILNLLK